MLERMEEAHQIATVVGVEARHQEIDGERCLDLFGERQIVLVTPRIREASALTIRNSLGLSA